jgi:hypothetical protein
MKKWIPLLILAVILFVVSFLPLHLLPAWEGSSGSTSVSPSSPRSVSLHMTFGSQVEGRIQISGANNDIYFYILDSAGRRVFDAGRIYNNYAFYWQAPKNDYFRFTFDNSMSWISTKNVNWSFSIYYYTLVLWIAGAILLAIAIVLLIKNEILQK